MAVLFLASASFASVANAHALCAETPGASISQESAHAHDHGDSTGAHSHEDIKESQGKTGFDGSDNVITVCHGNAGCPGCVLSSGTSFPSVKAITIAFRHSAIEGSSTDPDSSLRPPKFS